MPPADRRPKQQRIPKSKAVLLPVHTLVCSIVLLQLRLALSGMRRECLTLFVRPEVFCFSVLSKVFSVEAILYKRER